MTTKLYLDLNIYNRPFDDQRQARIRLETSAILILFGLLESGQYEAHWSFVLDYENSRNPVVDRAATIGRLALVCKHTTVPSDDIRALAHKLADLSSITALDALHLACAETGHCNYFVTCDDRLTRQAQQLVQNGQVQVKAINPVDLLRREALG